MITVGNLLKTQLMALVWGKKMIVSIFVCSGCTRFLAGQKSTNTRFLHGFGTRILQDKDSCKFEKLAWIWNRFLANLPNLETSWQDLARYF